MLVLIPSSLMAPWSASFPRIFRFLQFGLTAFAPPPWLTLWVCQQHYTVSLFPCWFLETSQSLAPPEALTQQQSNLARQSSHTSVLLLSYRKHDSVQNISLDSLRLELAFHRQLRPSHYWRFQSTSPFSCHVCHLCSLPWSATLPRFSWNCFLLCAGFVWRSIVRIWKWSILMLELVQPVSDFDWKNSNFVSTCWFYFPLLVYLLAVFGPIQP